MTGITPGCLRAVEFVIYLAEEVKWTVSDARTSFRGMPWHLGQALRRHGVKSGLVVTIVETVAAAAEDNQNDKYNPDAAVAITPKVTA